jgi:hypothetical protein
VKEGIEAKISKGGGGLIEKKALKPKSVKEVVA